MKTLIVYSLIPEETKFFLVEGDRRDLNGLFVNSTDDIPEELEEEIAQGNRWGGELLIPAALDLQIDGPQLLIVHCGFVL